MPLPGARVFTHAPLLGTVVEVQVVADPSTAEAADAAAVAEFERLNLVFSTHLRDSELARWRCGELQDCSPDLVRVLAAAAAWHRASGGAFDPDTGRLTALWRRAEHQAGPPSAADLIDAGAGSALPFAVTSGLAVRLGDCRGVDLNAIAKGYIVDRTVAVAKSLPGVAAVAVNAGGDLRHWGSGWVDVGIEDPRRPFDNAPPRWRVRLDNLALATSGSARRGFRVGENWHGHVLDPRTGLPVAHTAAVSVLAADAMTADALATVLGVLSPEEALAFAAESGVACLIVTGSGAARASAAWPG